MAKILVCDKISQNALDGIKSLGHEVLLKTGMDEAQLIETIPPYDVAIVRSATKIKKPVLDAAKSLKVIIRGGVGVDNIDAEYAKSKGMQVRNTPGASSASVAEMALAHMFSVYRFVAASTWRMRKGDDFKAVKKDYEGKELSGKTLGIVGIGRIGKELAKRAIGLGMKVIAHDAFLTDSGIKDVPLVSFEEILTKADVISLHVPKTDKPIIGRDEINKMKNGAVIINTARGGAIDEKALIEALDAGKLWGAGIDVFENEPTPKPEVVNHPRISVTPHLGASSHEAQDRIGGEIIEILREVFK